MLGDYLKALKLFNRNVRLFLAFGVLFGFAHWGIFMMLSNLYVLRLGFGPETVGLLIAVATATWSVFALPAGALARRWGVRRTLIAGMGLCTAAMVLLPLGALPSQTWQLVWLLSVQVLYGIGSGGVVASYTPFLAGSTGETERPHAFSVWAGMVALTAFAGGLAAGALPSLFSRFLGLPVDHPAPFRYPLLIAGLLMVPGVLLLLATRDVAGETAEATRAAPGPAPVGLISLLAGTYLLWGLGQAVGVTFFNVYLDAGLQVPTQLVGTVYAVGQLLGGAASLAAPFPIARWGKRRALVLGALGIAAGLLLLALIPHWAVAGLGYVGISIMVNITTAAFSVFSQESVAPGWRSTMAGASGMTYGLAYVVAGIGGGATVTALGYRPMFGLAAILPAVAALVMWAGLRAPRAAVDDAQPAETG
jgi:MFS family permease